MRRFYLESFGCQMNVYDTQGLDRLLSDHGYARVGAPEDADVILVNTCSVREHAEERTLNRLAVLSRLKSNHPDLLVGVTGCMAQRMGEEIQKRVRGVDLIVGAQALPLVLPALERLRTGASGSAAAREAAHVAPLESYLPPPRPESDGPPLKSFVTVIRGCNKACAYCIVPTTRGPEVSRPADDIVREVADLVAAGAREIMLLGQNVNSYGAGGVDFPELLRLCGEVEGTWRLRFTTSHPRDMSRAVLDRMSRVPRLAPWLHLPVQSGSRRILKAMNRDYSLDHYLDVVDAARETIPDLALSSDLIVGFPGETIEDFEETVRLIERVRYDTFYIFKYSARSGTAAAARPDDVNPEEKQRRLAILLDLQRKLSHEVNQAWVGRTLDVLVEGRDTKRGSWLTRTGQNKIAVLPAETADVSIGAFVRAAIARAEGQTLHGTLAGAA